MNDSLELTDIEQAFRNYDRASVSNLSAVAEWEGEVDSEALRAALAAVAARHPYLRHIFEDGRLAPHASAPVDCAEAEGSWLAVVADELHAPFDAARLPLLRARLVRSERRRVLIVTFPHLIADGAGAVRWMRELFETLVGEPSAGERMFPRPRSQDFDARRAQPPRWTWGEPRTVLSAEPLEGNPPPPISPPNRARVEFFHADAASTARLSRRCATEGVTLNAWFTAAALTVFGEFWRERGLNVVKTSATIDYRELLGVEPGDLGLWAGRLHLWARPEGAGLTELARGVQSGLFHLLRRSAFHEMTALARGEPSVRDPAALPLLKITNLGDFDERGLSLPLRGGRLSWLHAFTALHRGWAANLGFGLIPAVFDGRLRIAFESPDPGMDGPLARALSNSFLELLGVEGEWDQS